VFTSWDGLSLAYACFILPNDISIASIIIPRSSIRSWIQVRLRLVGLDWVLNRATYSDSAMYYSTIRAGSVVTRAMRISSTHAGKPPLNLHQELVHACFSPESNSLKGLSYFISYVRLLGVLSGPPGSVNRPCGHFCLAAAAALWPMRPCGPCGPAVLRPHGTVVR